jgi:hypothetical protein
MGNNQKSEDFKKIKVAYYNSFPRPSWKNDDAIEKFQQNFTEWLDEINNNELITKCYYADKKISIVGITASEDAWWVFPSDFVSVSEYKNYDNLTGIERKRMLTGLEQSVNEDNASAAIIKAGKESKADLLKKQSETEDTLSDLKQKMQDVKEAKIEGLALIKKWVKERELQEKKDK